MIGHRGIKPTGKLCFHMKSVVVFFAIVDKRRYRLIKFYDIDHEIHINDRIKCVFLAEDGTFYRCVK